MRNRDDTQNLLLSRMSESDFAALRPLLEPVQLPMRRMLQTQGRRIEHAFFLEAGIASLVASGGAERRVEVGLIGREGMTGIALALGVDIAPCDTFMQVAGNGWSIQRDALAQVLNRQPELRSHLLRYVHTMVVQMSFTALANGKYSIAERLARWLLMAQDRGDGGDGHPLKLTHEFLALMLGVRRPGVTSCLNILERAGLISMSRGAIIIIDRAGLEDATNGCYGAPETEFERLFAPAPPPTALAS